LSEGSLGSSQPSRFGHSNDDSRLVRVKSVLSVLEMILVQCPESNVEKVEEFAEALLNEQLQPKTMQSSRRR